jgi:hypothetical protein
MKQKFLLLLPFVITLTCFTTMKCVTVEQTINFYQILHMKETSMSFLSLAQGSFTYDVHNLGGTTSYKRGSKNLIFWWISYMNHHIQKYFLKFNETGQTIGYTRTDIQILSNIKLLLYKKLLKVIFGFFVIFWWPISK